jgi:SAM-dependent methyltransferase
LAVAYIHGTESSEQQRLVALNALTNAPFLAWLDVPVGARVLEVGSGLGILAHEVARRAGLTIGLEYSGDQLRQATGGAPALWFVRGDAHILPFHDAMFEVVYCRYVLEHVAGPQTVLQEVFRVLSAGGRVNVQENDILIATFDPDCPAFEEIWKRFAGLQSELGGDARIGKKLYSLLTGAGFTDVSLSIAPEVHHAGMPSFAPWLENLIGNVRSAERSLIERRIASAGEIREACQELEALKGRRDSAAFFYWTRARGYKRAPTQERNPK